MVRVPNDDSLRQRVFKAYIENSYVTAKKLCEEWTETLEDLKKFYKKHGGTINKYLSEFRTYHILGSPQKPLNLHRRIFKWENISRELLPEYVRDGFVEWMGWRRVDNRNGMYVFKDDLGSVHWYLGGTVYLYLKGSLTLADVKTLFCKAFHFLSNDDFKRFLDCPLYEERRHWVFDVGALMPRFDIRQFEKSHGLRVFTDGSHPTSLEFEETRPLNLIQFEETIDRLDSTIENFGVNLQEHMKLIKAWQKETDVRRRRRRSNVRRKKAKKVPEKVIPKKGWLHRLFEWVW